MGKDKLEMRKAAEIASKLTREAKRKEQLNKEYYAVRGALSNSWAIFYLLLGGREAGKSYSVTETFVRQWRKYGRPFYWMRLTDRSQSKLLQNNAEKLIDADIRRKYNVDIMTKGDGVYEVKRDENGEICEKKLMARVLALSTFYNDKGSALFDKDFLDDPKMYYNICLDEMNREANEKNSFDIVYAFTNQLENLVRSTKQRVRVICIGNTLQEASDILCAFNFIPENYGRYKLKKKRCLIEYMEPSAKYLERRKGTIADILQPQSSTFTNKIETDDSLVCKKRLIHPHTIIKFRKAKDKWFTVWDDGVIKRWNGENGPVIAMRPYLDEMFSNEGRNTVIALFDSRSYQYHDLITFKLFQKEVEELKPRK